MKQLFAFLLFGFVPMCFSQSIEAGAWLGATNSFNDINNNTSFITSRPAGGLIGKYNINERFAAELMASYGRTYSADGVYKNTDYTTKRNEGNRTSALDFQLAGEFNFKKFGGNTLSLGDKSNWTPYLSAGVGLSLLNTQYYSRTANSWKDLSEIKLEETQSLNPLQINIPLAAGVKYKLDNRFTLSGEFGSRILFTDYYDGVSTVYNANGIEQTPGTITTVGKQRGDRSRKDAYNLFGVQLTYIINPQDCP